MLGLGGLLVVLLSLAYRLQCPWPRSAGTVCKAIVDSPPWTLLTSLAAAPALVLTWWWRTVHKDKDIGQKQIELDLAKREERSRRFVESVRLLADKEKEARLGAIYSLESLASDSLEERQRVVETLCAFLREHGQSDRDRKDIDCEFLQPVDVQAAFTVIIRIPNVRGLDLRRAKLTHIEGMNGSFHHAALQLADLRNAMLFGADLQGARLCWVDMRGAFLSNANLNDADLSEANFASVNLDAAKLVKANLYKADLTGVHAGGLICAE